MDCCCRAFGASAVVRASSLNKLTLQPPGGSGEEPWATNKCTAFILLLACRIVQNQWRAGGKKKNSALSRRRDPTQYLAAGYLPLIQCHTAAETFWRKNGAVICFSSFHWPSAERGKAVTVVLQRCLRQGG